MGDVLVGEALSSVLVVSVREDDPVSHAARVLLHHRISSAPVLDADHRLVGMVSESDLLRGRVGRDPRAHLVVGGDLEDPGDVSEGPGLVRDVMTPHPVTVGRRDDLADAVDVLLDRGFKAVPVLEGHQLVGVLARCDVLRTITHPDEDVQRAVSRRLAVELPHEQWDVEVDDGVVTLSGSHEAASQRVAAVLARTVPGVVRVLGAAASRSYDARVRPDRPRGRRHD